MASTNADQTSTYYDEVSHVQVKFTTKSTGYSLPDHPLSVPTTLDPLGLSSLVNELLKAKDEEWREVSFDFLIDGTLLRLTLDEHIKSQSLSTENVIVIECIRQTPPPSLDCSCHHDNWVGGVHCCKEYIVTGCYDNKVYIWDHHGNQLMSLDNHSGPVKAVQWIGLKGTLLSASHDQYIFIWKMNSEPMSCELQYICKGHTQSVEGVSVSPDCSRFASVSWDKLLKVWSLSEDEEEVIEERSKKHKGLKKSKYVTKTPLVTLSGHTQAIVGVVWSERNDIITCGWDHSIRIWDTQTLVNKSTLSGSKVLHAIDVNFQNGLLATASSDPYVRIWDPRLEQDSVVKMMLSAHNGWVKSVKWSPSDENQLLSASYDGTLRLCDIRSPKVPLYVMTAHDDKILCADWTVPNMVASGGADGYLRLHGMESL